MTGARRAAPYYIHYTHTHRHTHRHTRTIVYCWCAVKRRKANTSAGPRTPSTRTPSTATGTRAPPSASFGLPSPVPVAVSPWTVAESKTAVGRNGFPFHSASTNFILIITSFPTSSFIRKDVWSAFFAVFCGTFSERGHSCRSRTGCCSTLELELER